MKKKHIKSLILDENQNIVTDATTGETKKIEPRLVSLLSILIEAKGKVVPRSQIIQMIWGNYNSGDQLLTHSIAMLRKEIGKETIKTIPKKGYLIEYDAYSNKRNYNNKWTPFYWLALIAILMTARFMFFPHH